MSIRVLLADDHAMMRDGLRALLTGKEGVEVVGGAASGREAVEMAEKLSPDVVVMDIAMPDLNGVEATRRVLGIDPKIKVVALSTHNDRQFILAMLEAGACAYVMKGSASGELVRAIQAVMQGQKYLSPDAAGAVVDSYTGRLFPTDASPISMLAEREREVLQLLAEGKTSKEIADQLQISVKTVDAHRQNIMRKLNLHSVAELTKFAVRHGLTSL